MGACSVTEDEAKTKWCPFARVVAGNRGNGGVLTDILPASNRTRAVNEGATYITDAAMCIGSACMAWRKSGLEQRDGEFVDTGYCGLAGPVQ